MKEKIHKIVKTGYGLGLLSIAQAKKIVKDVKKDLNLNEKDSLRLAKELVTSSEKATRDVLRTVDKHFSKALVKTKLVKKRELSRIKRLVKRRLGKTVKKSTKPKRRTKK